MSTTEVHDLPTWTLADRLIKAREHAGLTQDELATRLGRGKRSIVRYESGTKQPSRPIVIAWAHQTAVPLWWLDSEIEAPVRSRWFRRSTDGLLTAAA